MILDAIIPGQPRAQKRHRTSGWNRYDPSDGDKGRVQDYLLKMKPKKPYSGAFILHIIAFFKTPKDWSKVKKSRAEGGYRPKTPDWDNIGKLIADAMNGYIIADDGQIVKGTVECRYSVKPCTIIKLYKVNDDEYES